MNVEIKSDIVKFIKINIILDGDCYFVAESNKKLRLKGTISHIEDDFMYIHFENAPKRKAGLLFFESFIYIFMFKTILFSTSDKNIFKSKLPLSLKTVDRRKYPRLPLEETTIPVKLVCEQFILEGIFEDISAGGGTVLCRNEELPSLNNKILSAIFTFCGKEFEIKSSVIKNKYDELAVTFLGEEHNILIHLINNEIVERIESLLKVE